MRNTINDKEKLAEKLSDDDKETIKEALKTHQEWLDAHPDSDKEEYEEHLKDITSVCEPIVGKHYGKPQDQPGSGEDYEEDHTSDL